MDAMFVGQLRLATQSASCRLKSIEMLNSQRHIVHYKGIIDSSRSHKVHEIFLILGKITEFGEKSRISRKAPPWESPKPRDMNMI